MPAPAAKAATERTEDANASGADQLVPDAVSPRAVEVRAGFGGLRRRLADPGCRRWPTHRGGPETEARLRSRGRTRRSSWSTTSPKLRPVVSMQRGVRCGLHRGNGSGGVLFVRLLGGRSGRCSAGSVLHERRTLHDAAARSTIEPRGHEELAEGVGEDDRSLVAALGDYIVLLGELALPANQKPADFRAVGDMAGRECHLDRPDPVKVTSSSLSKTRPGGRRTERGSRRAGLVPRRSGCRRCPAGPREPPRGTLRRCPGAASPGDRPDPAKPCSFPRRLGRRSSPRTCARNLAWMISDHDGIPFQSNASHELGPRRNRRWTMEKQRRSLVNSA